MKMVSDLARKKNVEYKVIVERKFVSEKAKATDLLARIIAERIYKEKSKSSVSANCSDITDSS